jgi:hypothetical protein
MEVAATSLTGARANREQLKGVRSEVTYARRLTESDRADFFLPRYDIPFIKHETTIRDARSIENDLSLDREGFVLVKHKTSCAEIRDPGIMRQKYLEEMVPFIQTYFNASWVTVPSNRLAVVLRTESTEGFGTMAHIDFAPAFGPVAAAREDQAQAIPIRAYSRLLIIQAWRALSPPPQDIPLALCDCSTVKKSDVVTVTQSIKNEPGNQVKSCLLHFNPEQRWYYFPELTSDELLLFKGYDSDRYNDVFAAHCAFDNREAYPDANPRASVEGRFFVFYE